MDRDNTIEAHYRDNYERLVRSIGHRVGYDNSEDAVQEAYARALKYWPAFDPDEGTFVQWFTSILNNAQKDVLNIQTRTVAVSLTDTMSAGARSGGALQGLELAKVAELLGLEPPPRRQALKLALVEGYSYIEVAEMLPMTVGNIKWHVNQFRKKL